MKDSTIFENLNFNRTINTVSQDFFPCNFPLHWHKYGEVAAFPISKAPTIPPVITISQTTYLIEPGDLILIWPGEIHEISGNENCQLIGLQFPFTFLNDLPDFSPYINLFRSCHHIKSKNAPELAQNMVSFIQSMIIENESQKTLGGVEALIDFYKMFMELALYLQNTAAEVSPSILGSSKATQGKIQDACSYITEHCQYPLTLSEVADYIGFSTYYFSRIFKKITTYSFVEYLALQRMKRAQTLLSESSYSITEVSYLSGFKSISTFNRVFQQHRGCSPRAYRKYYLRE